MQSRILTRIGYYHDEERVTVDYGGFAQDLLLYDTVLINSIQLKEIVALVNDLGVNAVVSLLDSGALKICVRNASIGMPDCPDASTYKLIAVHTSDQDEYLARCFKKLEDKVKANRKDVDRLKNSIRSCLIPESIDPFLKTLVETKKDILSGPPYLQRILRRRGQSDHKILLEIEDVISKIEEIETDLFRIECAPLSKLGMAPEVCRKLVQTAGVAPSEPDRLISC